MLSYMIPVDTADKPPPVPSNCAHSKQPAAPIPHLNLNLMHHSQNKNIVSNGNSGTTAVHRSCLVTNATTANSSSILMSKDSSVNSFASDVTTGTGSSASGAATPLSGTRGGTVKMVAISSNGGPVHQQVVQVVSGKHHSLKRVSFGSSKGSMVETLIYESPLQEEPESSSPIPENGRTPFPEDGDQIEDERERVRVSFVQHSKPQEVQLPDEPVILTDSEFIMAATAIAESNHVISAYTRQESTESGWDNPFRPGGDLSREADEIVELIKGGKPITPTSSTAPIVGTGTVSVDGTVVPIAKSPIDECPANKKSAKQVLQQSPPSTNTTTKNGASSANKNGGTNSTSAVNVQRATTGQPSGDVEHVLLKKEKSKCKCCVVQ